MKKDRDSGNAFTRWRRGRRAQRESRLLIKETRRILRRFRRRLKPEAKEEIDAGLVTLVDARQTKEYGKIRDAAERLDHLLEKHASSARKSALREYAESIGVAVLIALLLRAFVVEAFKIPSGSMIPTLKIGDHIFVNKFIYGLRIPWTNIKFFDTKPERGDVIVFIYPRDPDKDFIKRIAAVGGDTVSMRNNVVHVNGKAIEHKKLNGSCKYVDGDENSTELTLASCQAFAEKNSKNHYRVIQDLDSFPSDFPPKKIPEGEVFVMGDNRDNSHDSRVWGTVPHGNIKGKAMIIWWSSGAPNGVRWKRFFRLVHGKSDNDSVTP